ncbi:hypothetical protein [Paenibacillus sp. FSL R7-0331]|uniref:hypothetical protein n=1 Tax=Paenibacillus sp. FSL R7-0331 TaxID=1536773 RepID=UPI0006938C06|nr:hypothetical protein [Paenibacillus sp. FSL R7-0331]
MNRDNIQHEWKRYVQGELTAPEREQMDRMLLEDPEALGSYLLALENLPVPLLSGGDAFADQIMVRIAPLSASAVPETGTGRSRLGRLLGNQWLHYIAAACITMLFISAGIFDKLAPGNIGVTAQTKQPYSEIMVKKATGWLAEMKPAPYKQ